MVMSDYEIGIKSNVVTSKVASLWREGGATYTCRTRHCDVI